MRQFARFLAKGKTFLLLLLIVLSWQGTGRCDAPKQAAADYAPLLERLKGGDTAIDYMALRYAYVKSAGYDPYARNDEARDAMLKAMDGQDYAAAVKHAQALLSKNYQDMEAHFFSNIAYRELKNSERQKFHSTVLKGLIGSLYTSGDGQKPETAYVVINTDEEYFMLRINGYKVIRQKLLQKDGSNIDEMEVEYMKSGEQSKIYFNVDFPFKWLNEQFKKK